MGYTANDIRNICLLGHGGDGKSALCESMLFTTKAITRLGKRADGTTVSDFDDEEKKRQYSISTSVIPVEYNKCKINVLDNPGYFDFAGQIVQSLRVSDAGIICLTAKSGIGVGTEKGWKYLAKAGLPAMFYISKLDEEHANFFNVFDSLREMFGASVIPFTFPILKGEQAVGLVDLIEKKAYDANGKEIPLPAEAEEKIEEYMAELNEQVAETDEALMEKFFMEEPFTEEELLTGIKAGIRDRSVTPVFCGCAYTGLGTTNLLSNLVKFARDLYRSHVHQVDAFGLHNREVGVFACLDAVVDECAVIVERSIALSYDLSFLDFSCEVYHVLVVEVYLAVVHLAVRSLDEAEVVDFSIYAEAGYKADVRAFRGLDRAHTTIVRIVNVSNLESSSVS